MIQLLSEDEILEQVDEYLLYCFYSGYDELELRRKYKCPYRPDKTPSWSLFENSLKLGKKEYRWKDNGSNASGDIYDLVQRVCKLDNRWMAIARVREDFIFGNKKELIRPVTRPVSIPSRITIKSKPMQAVDLVWWAQFGISEALLKQYHVTRVGYYWLFEEQESPRFPYDLAYAYRVYDHYKLYFPKREKEFRFRNDFGELHLEGFCQLDNSSDLLIRTKSLKDVMTLRSFGYEAVSPRGEHTPIPELFEKEFRTRYKRHMTLFDNDGKHRAWDYDMASMEVPLDSGEKDISDYYRRYGRERTGKLLQYMIKNHPYMQIDWNKPMTRDQLEQFMETHYLNQVISIQQKDTTLVVGKVDRLSVSFSTKSSTQTKDDLMCTLMINQTRYEFPLIYFLQKAQIFKHGNSQ